MRPSQFRRALTTRKRDGESSLPPRRTSRCSLSFLAQCRDFRSGFRVVHWPPVRSLMPPAKRAYRSEESRRHLVLSLSRIVQRIVPRSSSIHAAEVHVIARDLRTGRRAFDVNRDLASTFICLSPTAREEKERE